MGHGATLLSFGGPEFSEPTSIGPVFVVLQPDRFQPLDSFNDRVTAFSGRSAGPARPVMPVGHGTGCS
jgi:hypothetical protein